MGLFGNKKEVKKMNSEDIPELPKLPELPELHPSFGDNEQLPKLPSFPSNSTGNRFSENMVKDAVKGFPIKEDYANSFRGKEDDEDEEDADMQMTPRSSRKVMTREVPESFRQAHVRMKKNEPLFIRIDKFEESMKIVEKARQKITELEEMLNEVKKIKDEEERELTHWENSIQTIKSEIEKVDQDIFSRVE